MPYNLVTIAVSLAYTPLTAESNPLSINNPTLSKSQTNLPTYFHSLVLFKITIGWPILLVARIGYFSVATCPAINRSLPSAVNAWLPPEIIISTSLNKGANAFSLAICCKCANKIILLTFCLIINESIYGCKIAANAGILSTCGPLTVVAPGDEIFASTCVVTPTTPIL